MKLFDYGTITDEHKEAVQEVMSLAKQFGNEEFAEFIKHKFKIIEPLRLPYEITTFYQECEKVGIKVHLMGYVQDNGGSDPTLPSYPVVSITEDIRKLEELIKSIKND